MEVTTSEEFQKGVSAHLAGNTQEAERFYRAVLQVQPDHPGANHNLGILAVYMNKNHLSLPFFKTALEANANVEKYWLSYIEALIAERHFQEAMRALKKAKKKGVAKIKLTTLKQKMESVKTKNLPVQLPSQAEMQKLLNYYQSRCYDDAEDLAVSISKKFPSHPFSWKILGVIYKASGRITDALTASETATELDPKDDQAHNSLGVILEDLDRLEEAEASYKTAIFLNSNNSEAHCNLGNALRKLAKFEESLVSYRQAIIVDPNDSEAYNNVGITLRELGRLEEAEANYNKAVALKSDFVRAHNNLGVTLQELGRLEESEVSLRQALTLKPGYLQARNNLGNTLKGLGKFKEAISNYQQAFVTRSGILSSGDKALAPGTTSLFFELTNKCNFHCVFCPSDSQKRDLGSMDFDLVKRLYEEAANKKIASEVNLHLMGEPTLHPKLIEILNFAASKKIKTDLVTNGSTLVDKTVPKILDALYGTITASHMTPTEDTYHFRGKVGLSWDRYISNLRLLVREYLSRLAKGDKIKNNISIRVMVSQNTAANVNINETPNEARAILKEWNDFVAKVEQELKMKPFKRKNHDDDDDILRGNRHANTSYSLQKGIKLTFWRAFTFANTRVSEDFELKTRKEASYCPHPFTDVGVLWNGDVTLCCLDHDGQLKVGNIRDSSMEDIIQNKDSKKLRASMLGRQPLPHVCKTCQARPVKRVS